MPRGVGRPPRTSVRYSGISSKEDGVPCAINNTPTRAVTGVVFRAIGPSLASFGVPQPLQDPMLELHNGNGDLIASNDDWQSAQKSEIEAVGLAPSDSRESAILLRNFDPGPYTAIVRGAKGWSYA